MTRMNARVVAVLGLIAALVPATIEADAATGTESLSLTGGSLSISSVNNGTVSGTIGASPAAGTLGSASWSDATGSGAGWHGQIAVTLFNYTSTWAAGTSSALANSTSGTYTGTGSGYYKVAIVSDSASVITYNVTGLETQSNQTVNHAAQATANVGTHGVTITFKAVASQTYVNTDSYTLDAGNLSSTALQLQDGNGNATITAGSGTTSSNPAFENSTSTVSGSTPTTAGSAVNFVTAALLTGMGSYTVTPYVNITFDPSVWAASYGATATFTIVSGP